MASALLIRLQPAGPWRFGPGDGALDRTDTLYRSDRLYSAVTLAMEKLGWLEEWLASTARAPQPAVAFSSLFPFQGDTLFAIPPATLWPPAAAQVSGPNPAFLAKIRWKAAQFVPLSVIDALVTGGRLVADQWLPDAESGCLLRRDRPNASPFRKVVRRMAAVDRLSRTAPGFSNTACVEFEPGAGLWTLVRFADTAAENAWSERVEAAFRLLADSGFGGRRSSGWGHAKPPIFERGTWPALLLPKLGRLRAEPDGTASYWLLSLYSPASSDQIDWQGGSYRLTVRAGGVDSRAGRPAFKKAVRMVSEGSVLAARAEPLGAAVDVSPDGFAHAVYRSGLALALALPAMVAPAEFETVEEVALVAPASVPEVSVEPEPEPISGTPDARAAGAELLAPEEREDSVATPEASPAAVAEPESKSVSERESAPVAVAMAGTPDAKAAGAEPLTPEEREESVATPEAGPEAVAGPESKTVSERESAPVAVAMAGTPDAKAAGAEPLAPEEREDSVATPEAGPAAGAEPESRSVSERESAPVAVAMAGTPDARAAGAEPLAPEEREESVATPDAGPAAIAEPESKTVSERESAPVAVVMAETPDARAAGAEPLTPEEREDSVATPEAGPEAVAEPEPAPGEVSAEQADLPAAPEALESPVEADSRDDLQKDDDESRDDGYEI